MEQTHKMEHTQFNPVIVIDSETGIYWKGEHVLRNQELIKTVIKQEVAKRDEKNLEKCGKPYTDRYF